MKTTISLKNSVAERNPQLAKEAFGWDPSTITINSKIQCDWQCRKCNLIWTAQPSNRNQNQTGCPVCYVIKPGINDVVTKSPMLALEAYGWDPTRIPYSSNRPKWWQCHKCLHLWKSSPARRYFGKQPCPKCKEAKKNKG